jgi:predicted DCC family thiol-disulfide oxidoreductase YuxK
MNHTIVFFDDSCLLCNSTLQWILRNEKTHTLCFAPLSGIHAKGLIERFSTVPDSIIVSKNNELYVKSLAIIQVLKEMGGIWKLVSICLRCIPNYIRDVVYDFIAKNRYQWFGTVEECLLMKGNYSSRFLD